MTTENGEPTIPEIRQLLGHFRKLQELARTPLPEKNNGLWEQAKQEAKEELVEQLKRRERGMTLRPDPTSSVRRPTEVDQRGMDAAIDAAIEAKAARKYLTLDAAYSSALTERERKVYELVKTIDHFMTPMRHKLRALPEADRTLLVAEWREVREKYSIKEIMRFDEDGNELYARTIQALEAVERQLRQKNSLASKVWHLFLDILSAISCGYFKSQG